MPAGLYAAGGLSTKQEESERHPLSMWPLLILIEMMPDTPPPLLR
jgi:hypothetical protein